MKTDYERYIRTDELLALQKSLAEQFNHDELLFQVTHQASELWMKAVLQDLDEAVRLMLVASGEELPASTRPEASTNLHPAFPRAVHLLRRAARIISFLSQQILILEMMHPVDYHQIRVGLERGSGQDSPGFNQILAMAQPITRAYQALLSARSITPLEILKAPHQHVELTDLVQALLEVDEQFSRFRQYHVSLVRREIGLDVISTKGQSAQKLVGPSRSSMFQELWDAIAELTNTYKPTY